MWIISATILANVSIEVTVFLCSHRCGSRLSHEILLIFSFPIFYWSITSNFLIISLFIGSPYLKEQKDWIFTYPSPSQPFLHIHNSYINIECILFTRRYFYNLIQRLHVCWLCQVSLSFNSHLVFMSATSWQTKWC